VELWLGPVLVAAVVSGLVNIFGWYVTFRSTRKLDLMRRGEKVHDFQVALRAEVSSDLLNMEVADRASFLQDVAARFAADPSYSPVVPRLASNVVFEAIVREVHVLPAAVIAPVIHYARLRQTLEQFVEDMRSESFRRLPSERQLTMYSDYIATYDRLEALAQNAVAALDDSLNSSGAVLSNQASASGSDVVLPERSAEP
jgi:hypothetical protein